MTTKKELVITLAVTLGLIFAVGYIAWRANKLPDVAPPAVQPEGMAQGIEPDPDYIGLLPGEDPLIGTMSETPPMAMREVDYGPKLVKMDPEKIRGKNIKIGVFDTGAQVDHPWLVKNIKGTYNAINGGMDVTDKNGHGSHTASILTEALPDCELYIVKVLDDDGSGSITSIKRGLDYAVKTWGIDVASFSLGGPSPNATLAAAIKDAQSQGVIVVAAAGNSGRIAGVTDGYPAKYPGVISVGAVDRNNVRADFSSRGPSLWSMAPGVGINGAYPGNRSVRYNGTSMACPLIAAVAGGWIEHNPTVPRLKRPVAFREEIAKFSDRWPNRSDELGYGLPDASKLITVAPSPPPVRPPAPVDISVGWDDLTPAAQGRLKAAGVNAIDLKVGVQK